MVSGKSFSVPGAALHAATHTTPEATTCSGVVSSRVEKNGKNNITKNRARRREREGGGGKRAELQLASLIVQLLVNLSGPAERATIHGVCGQHSTLRKV